MPCAVDHIAAIGRTLAQKARQVKNAAQQARRPKSKTLTHKSVGALEQNLTSNYGAKNIKLESLPLDSPATPSSFYTPMKRKETDTPSSSRQSALRVRILPDTPATDRTSGIETPAVRNFDM